MSKEQNENERIGKFFKLDLYICDMLHEQVEKEKKDTGYRKISESDIIIKALKEYVKNYKGI